VKNILKRIVCFFGFHGHSGCVSLGSYMARSGPRFLYQCKRCRAYYSERWSAGLK
jgi:hypothetical protein